MFAALFALPVSAAERLLQQTPSIEVYQLSPGASGSINSSSSSQRYDVPQVPGIPEGISTRSTSTFGSSAVQQSGGIRQSIEYPNGRIVPQQPRQEGYQYRRDE
jgi:hypothetical protein